MYDLNFHSSDKFHAGFYFFKLLFNQTFIPIKRAINVLFQEGMLHIPDITEVRVKKELFLRKEFCIGISDSWETENVCLT